MTGTVCHLNQEATQHLVSWANSVRETADSPFAAAQQLVTRLGAHYHDGKTEVGFWVPELVEREIPTEQTFLEILTPLEPINFRTDRQTVQFRREHLALAADGDYLWGVIEGMQPGRREQVGAFYWLKYKDRGGKWQTIIDPLAYSVPFGVNAPAELYDLDRLAAERADREYFAKLNTTPDPDGTPRVDGPVNILQIHVNTASAEGGLAGLAEMYRTIARKREAGELLTPAEENYVGYDSVQLMPIEPTIEYEAGPRFWQSAEEDDPTAETTTVTLHRPDMTNWGYDVVIAASPAPNPRLLVSKRPDELVDFVATLHTMPEKPIKVILDVVYGHADNQALPLLNHHYFAGSNMYGQNLNYPHPVVRAVLLEMQRRKNNLSGVDGVRVDGAQDFKWWDRETNTMIHDNAYLELMNNLVQEVAGQQFRPWMIFEDGRPWPRDDWELASSYREVNRLSQNVVQWGPLTFAHNTPFLFTFWLSKWWRIREIMEVGRVWITGCANHDTLRRGTQVDPAARVNTYLGQSHPEIFKNGYDNPAANLFAHVGSPGIPMDFINALMRAPWSFIRNTDDRYAVKVASEEARFLNWAVDETTFSADDAFPRLKAMGFTDYGELRRFMEALDHAVQMGGDNLVVVVEILNGIAPPLSGPAEYSGPVLKTIARAWMDDVFDYCNVSRWEHDLDGERTHFNLRVREFRQERPWLTNNLREDEFFNYRHPSDGSVVFYGLRRAPDNSEQVLFVLNMEGAPCTLTPTDLPISGLPAGGWQLALATPGVTIEQADQPVTLKNSQGVVFKLTI